MKRFKATVITISILLGLFYYQLKLFEVYANSMYIDDTNSNSIKCTFSSSYGSVPIDNEFEISFIDELENKTYTVTYKGIDDFRKIIFTSDDKIIYYVILAGFSWNGNSGLLYSLDKQTNKTKFLALLPFYDCKNLIVNSENSLKFQVEGTITKKNNLGVDSAYSINYDYIINKDGSNLLPINKENDIISNKSYISPDIVKKNIELYRSAIYHNQKKVASGTDIGSIKVVGNKLYYMDFDGQYYYIKSLDLKTDTVAVLMKSQIKIRELLVVSPSNILYSKIDGKSYILSTKSLIEKVVLNKSIIPDHNISGKILENNNFAALVSQGTTLYLFNKNTGVIKQLFNYSRKHFNATIENVDVEYVKIDKITKDAVYFTESAQPYTYVNQDTARAFGPILINKYKINLNGTKLQKIKNSN